MSRLILLMLLSSPAIFAITDQCSSNITGENELKSEEPTVFVEVDELEVDEKIIEKMQLDDSDDLQYDDYQYDDYQYDDYQYDYDTSAYKGFHKDDFNTYTVNDFWHYHECDELFELPLPIHNHSTWMLLRGIYQGAVGANNSSITPISAASGLHENAVVKLVPGKGRGVFASGTIQKGEKVWNTRQSARFSDGVGYRKFLLALPRSLACDVMQWAYVFNVAVGYDAYSLDPDSHGGDDDDRLEIAVDLDEGILMNDAEIHFNEVSDEEIQTGVQNLGCVPESAMQYPKGCNENIFALRDIAAGEELLINYGDFADGLGWYKFGL